MKKTSVTLTAAALLTATALAEDWPQWRGTARTGISSETGLLTDWPGDGPKQLWQASVGIGFSGMTVAKGKLYTLGWADEKDTLYCLDAATGKQLWAHSYEAELGDKYFEGGPLSTPTVDGDTVYSMGKWGTLTALEAATGKQLWSKNLAEEVKATVPDWGFSGSVHVEGSSLVLNLGSHGTAVEKATGKLLWKSGTDSAGYSTPLPITSSGEKLLAFSNTDAYFALSASTGKLAWSVDWPTRYGINAADIIPVAENRFFIGSGYGKGCALLDTTSAEPKIVWQNRDMRCQMNPPVLLDGHLYGIDGDEAQSPSLRCMEAATGKVKWKTPWTASGALMAAEGHLLAVNGKGEFSLIKATADGFEPIATAQLSSGRTWTVPTLAHGMLYLRNAAGDVLCFDLKKQ